MTQNEVRASRGLPPVAGAMCCRSRHRRRVEVKGRFKIGTALMDLYTRSRNELDFREERREVWSAPRNTTSEGVGFEVRADSSRLAQALAAQRVRREALHERHTSSLKASPQAAAPPPPAGRRARRHVEASLPGCHLPINRLDAGPSAHPPVSAPLRRLLPKPGHAPVTGLERDSECADAQRRNCGRRRT